MSEENGKGKDEQVAELEMGCQYYHSVPNQGAMQEYSVMGMPLPPRSNLVVSPAGFPYTQSFSIRKFTLKAKEDPTMTKKHLQSIFPKRRQMVVETYMHQPQQFSQVHLQRDSHLSHSLWGKGYLLQTQKAPTNNVQACGLCHQLIHTHKFSM